MNNSIAAAIARKFHEAYERLAPTYGYKTREESAVEWASVPENNRALMTATVAEVMREIEEDISNMADKVRLERSRREAAEGEAEFWKNKLLYHYDDLLRKTDDQT